HDSTGVIDLHGEINLGADQALLAAYDAAVRDDPRTVVLNFAQVEYINSTGIALIVGLLARARAEGRRVSVYGLSNHYREIFQITDQGGERPIPEVETPDLEAKLAGLQTPRGWGLFLIQEMVDDLRTAVDEHHHTIELVMHLKEAPDARS
ncbi:MAG TPA: STAS domain-containing protein, partial [Actinomycetota bacterium]|nr:STAS domain-containing protein [Actinomycetota bacterium]